MNRKEIMENCPEEFEDELKGFIDNIESRVNEIESKLEIKGICDLSNIEDAFDLVQSLSVDLY